MGLRLYFWVDGHGLAEGEDCCRHGVGASLEQIAAHDVDLVPGEFQLFLLIEDSVEEGIGFADHLAPLDDLVDQRRVEIDDTLA